MVLNAIHRLWSDEKWLDKMTNREATKILALQRNTFVGSQNNAPDGIIN
jgi:hypothetical protein